MNSIHSLLTLSKDWLDKFNTRQGSIRANQQRTSAQINQVRNSVRVTAGSAKVARNRAGAILHRFSATRAAIGESLQDGVEQAVTYDRNVRHIMAENNKRFVRSRIEELNAQLIPTSLAIAYTGGVYLDVSV